MNAEVLNLWWRSFVGTARGRGADLAFGVVMRGAALPSFKSKLTEVTTTLGRDRFGSLRFALAFFCSSARL